MRKHSNFYGLCDDGQIENGIGHISPLFDDLEATDIKSSIEEINTEMFTRLKERSKYREIWGIKEVYAGQEILSMELQCPAFEDEDFIQPKDYLPALAKAVYYTMRERNMLDRHVSSWDIMIKVRSSNVYRIFLKSDKPEESEIFARSMYEMFQPVAEARYVIFRFLKGLSFFQSLMKNVIGVEYNENIIYHPLPAVFADNKKHALEFTKHWQRYVTDGVEPLYIKHSEKTDELEKKDEELKIDFHATLKKVWQ